MPLSTFLIDFQHASSATNFGEIAPIPPLWQICKNIKQYILGLFGFGQSFKSQMLWGKYSLLLMAKYWKHNLVIWSHCMRDVIVEVDFKWGSHYLVSFWHFQRLVLNVSLCKWLPRVYVWLFFGFRNLFKTFVNKLTFRQLFSPMFIM